MMANFAELLKFLNELGPQSQSSPDPSEVALILQTYREPCLNLLKYEGPSPAARAEVMSLKVQTMQHGEARLDPEPDVRLALMLSDELKLNEVACVELLITCKEQRGIFSAESAAGFYLEERQAAAKALAGLVLDAALSSYVNDPGAPRHPYQALISDLVTDLLAEQAPGGQKRLVGRLVEILKDHSLEVTPASTLPNGRDEAGSPVSRSLMLQLERRSIAKALLYCTMLDQRLDSALVGELLDLLASLNSRLKGTGAGDVFLMEEAQLVSLAAALVLTPQEERAGTEKTALIALAADPAVKSRIDTSVLAASSSTDSHSAVLRMCYGLLQVTVQHPQIPDDARRHLLESLGSGSLSYLRGIFTTPFFLMDFNPHQEMVACVVLRLVGALLQADSTFNGVLTRALNERCTPPARPQATTYNSYGSGLSPSPFSASSDPREQQRREDHSGTLLDLLADILKVAPRLWNASSSVRNAENFIARVVMSESMKTRPEVRVPFLHLMTSFSVSEYGSSMVLRQFAEMGRTPGLEMLSWRKLFGTLVEYCVRYNSVAADIQRAGGAGQNTLAGPGGFDRLMNADEADILVAFLGLVRCLVEEGNLMDVRVWLESQEQELGALLGGHPLHEPLFQLMCHPVPNTVKAALDGVLAALTRFRDLAPRLLERLVRCAAVQPNMQMQPGMPRLDLITQINEIESRQEEYPETIAFVTLLNALISPHLSIFGLGEAPLPAATAAAAAAAAATAGPGSSTIPIPPLADGGADLEHFTLFVTQHVLGHLSQRGYRLAAQKWDVAGACFQHIHIMLLLAASSGLPASDVTRQPPGHHVMRDLLGGGPALQAILYILGPGFADLTSVRTQVDISNSREAAVLAALRVLHTALTMDVAFVRDLLRVNLYDRHQPLHVKLSHPMTLVTLLQYVCYSDSIDIQVASLQLMSALSQRLPNIVDTLIQAAPDLTAAVDIRRGVAAALKQGLDHYEAMEDSPGSDLQDSSASDPRASLIMHMLLESCNSVAAGPGRATLCQLLMGYEVELSQGGVSGCILEPQIEYSCLTVVERSLVIGGSRLSQSKPKLYSQMLSLLHRLACHPTSGGPMLDWLSPGCTDVVRKMRQILILPLPSQDQPQALAASLRQRASILQIQALLLLKLQHEESINNLLSDFFSTVSPSSSSGLDVGTRSMAMDAESDSVIHRSVALDLLRMSCSLQLPRTCQIGDVSGEERRLWQDMAVSEMSVVDMLTNPRVMELAGVQLHAEEGELQLYDIGALYPLLKERYDAYIARTGGVLARTGSPDLAAAAVASALKFAATYNAHMLVSSAQKALVHAWVRVVEVGFCLRYGQLEVVLLGCQAENLHELLVACLEECKHLLSLPDGPLPQLLANASRLLLSKLQEQAVVQMSLGQVGDPLGRVRTPTACHHLLSLLTHVLLASRRTLEVRVQLYAAMLQYLQYCRGSKLSNCPPVVLKSILQGWGSGPSALADLDTTQEAIERGNAALLAEYGPQLVALISVDALNTSAPSLQQAVALHLIGALVAADTRVGVSAAAHAQGVPQQLLHLLASVPQASVIQHSRKARRTMYVIEAQLSLLLRLTEAGPVRQRTASAQRVQALQAIPNLNACRALDLEPESIHGTNITSSSDSLRSRLPHVVAPTLRLLLSMLASLPESTVVRNEAAGFVLLHYRMVERILREAGSSSTATWSPGSQELEQAELAVALLCRLVPCFTSGELPPDISESLLLVVYQLMQVFGTLSTSSSSPLVVFAFGSGSIGHSISQNGNGMFGNGDDIDMGGPSANGGNMLALTNGQAAGGHTSSIRNTSAMQQAVASSILGLRQGLISFLRDMTVLGGGSSSSKSSSTAAGGLLLRAVGTGSSPLLDPTTSRPTLMLIRDMSQQAIMDAVAALKDLSESLERLQCPQQPALPVSGGDTMRASLQQTLQRASASDKQLSRALSVLETGLSVIVLHFLRCIPRPNGAMQGTMVRVGAGAGGNKQGSSTAWLEDALGGNGGESGAAGMGFNPTPEDAAKLGNKQELAFLKSRLQETVILVEDLLNQKLSGLGEHSLSGVDLLARTLKSYVMMD